MKLFLVIIASAAFAGALVAIAVWGVKSKGPSHRKATEQEMTLRARVLKETKLEPNVTIGEANDLPTVKLIFPVVPPAVDRKELEDKTRALVREEVPDAFSIDVGFGDNLRKKLALPPPPEPRN